MTEIDLRRRAEQERERQSGFAGRVFCCGGASCVTSGSQAVYKALRASLASRSEIECVSTGCMGLCSRGPLVRVEIGGGEPSLYTHATPDLAESLARSPDQPRNVETRRFPLSHPFFAKQTRIVLATLDRNDPTNLDHYLASGGYEALASALAGWTPAEICAEIAKSGLRGRGGAGYPTAAKWDLVRKAPDPVKFAVVNGDEGDPGAYMDRTIMEDDPHRVLEGVLIAAYAVGARTAYLYVRGEYPLAVERLRRAIDDARRAGLVGANILGARFSCDVEVRIGAGAYVCGEETALIASIEGGRGTPRVRPPYPPEHGVCGRPTLINNVETYANVPSVLRDGAERFAAVGSSGGKGTKVFSVTGALRNSGLIEVPMGIPLREIVYDMCEAVEGGVKAVQTGGPSGGCVPAEMFDLPVDYESLQKAGSIMGSGGMVVLGAETDMVGLAKYFMDFCRDESCGKCVPCRVGTVQMSRLLDRIHRGEGSLDDLDLLEEMCEVVRAASLCGLGQAAPNPVLGALRYFRREFLDKVAGRRRPRPAGDLSHMILAAPHGGFGT